MVKELSFPAGLHLLAKWQSGDVDARQRLKEIFDAVIAGELDHVFATPAPINAVNIGGSVNLMTLTLMHDFYGMESAEFYKNDPERYVRTTMASRRMLGMNKNYISWPIYAFTCEAMGQLMMYPDKFPPGSDPDVALINRENWNDIKTPDFDTGIPRIVDEFTECYIRLTGVEPLLQVSAPYSLAADIYGQEPLLAALVKEPDFVNELLDTLVDRVLVPWIDDFVAKFPGAWIELSDASGSPFFIGPDNCKNMAIRSIQRMISRNAWGDRVYDANYRGDYVTMARKKDRSAKRRGGTAPVAPAIDIDELTDLKHSVCKDFVIRLDDDRVPVDYYEAQAIERNVPLFCGIGASQIDRNSVGDLEIAKVEIANTAREQVAAIKNTAQTISLNGYDNRKQPWPGTVYFEDISSEAQFEMIEIIVRIALENGAINDTI